MEERIDILSVGEFITKLKKKKNWEGGRGRKIGEKLL